MKAELIAAIDYSIIQGAFYAGFEPSSNDLSDDSYSSKQNTFYSTYSFKNNF